MATAEPVSRCGKSAGNFSPSRAKSWRTFAASSSSSLTPPVNWRRLPIRDTWAMDVLARVGCGRPGLAYSMGRAHAGFGQMELDGGKRSRKRAHPAPRGDDQEARIGADRAPTHF